MIKTYCDVCGEEITKVNSFHGGLEKRIKIPNARNQMLVKVTLNEISKGIDCCKYCVLDAVKKMDDRKFVRPIDFQGDHK